MRLAPRLGVVLLYTLARLGVPFNLSLQCQSAADYQAAPSLMDFPQLSQRRSSSMFFFQRTIGVNASKERMPARQATFSRNDCTCEHDWADAFCTAAEQYNRLDYNRAPTICVCRQVFHSVAESRSCSQFLTRCFAEKPQSEPERYIRSRRDFPIIYAKSDIVERGTDGVLRRSWPQPREGATPTSSLQRVSNKLRQTPLVETPAAKTPRNSALSERCRCCFNQPDEYCNQLECRNMRPYFEPRRSASATNASALASAPMDAVVSCVCFQQQDYPRHICVGRRNAPMAAGVQARDVFLASETTRLKGAQTSIQRPFDRTASMRFLRKEDETIALNAPTVRLVRIEVAVLAALATSTVAVILAGSCYYAMRRLRRHAMEDDVLRPPVRNLELHSAATVTRHSLADMTPAEERVHMV